LRPPTIVCDNHTHMWHRAGGVFVTGSGGKIELNNTFEERLRMLETEALPSIRNTLFGENENRKFKD
jgi:V-type H+-transporting ATPase subunit E